MELKQTLTKTLSIENITEIEDAVLEHRGEGKLTPALNYVAQFLRRVKAPHGRIRQLFSGLYPKRHAILRSFLCHPDM